MVDSVSLFVNGGSLPSLSSLTEVFEGENCFGRFCGGRLGNLIVKENERGVSVMGSLPKYYLGNNASTLTRRDVGFALERISDELKIDVSTGVLKRVDVSTIIPTKKTPKSYFVVLGGLPRFERIETAADTLTYKQKTKMFTLYDKIKEMRAVGKSLEADKISSLFFSKNIMRLELQLKRPKNVFRGDLTADKLKDEQIYYSLVKMWGDTFKAIKTIKTMDLQKEIKTEKEAIYRFLLSRCERDELLAEVDTYIKQLKENNTFKDRNRYTRTKQGIEKCLLFCGGGGGDADSADYKEIAAKVNDVVRYAR